jgi:ribulose-5-phosphate 4-epimerase/fuculose-1-phosphate aldolase
MTLVEPTRQRSTAEAARWQARVDLAAAHRIAVTHGLSEGIFNHFTLAVPGADDRYYQIPFGLHWSEVTASSLMEVGYDGAVLCGEGEVEASAFCIHAPIHRLVKRHACVLHTHMPFASALARLEDPRLLAIGQTEIGFLDIVAYDEEYAGLAFDPAEGERLARVLGPDRAVLVMANHGVLACGESVAEAYDRRASAEGGAAADRGPHLAAIRRVAGLWREIRRRPPFRRAEAPPRPHRAGLRRLTDRRHHRDRLYRADGQPRQRRARKPRLCCRSTCSATCCAMRSTRAVGDCTNQPEDAPAG